ncbi:MAG: hypothetical protein IKL07_01410 [Clostridium sp.]|nr:hypothetical protein [Clostridium sp.]
MPWCPKCRQEFQNQVTVCPNCDEPLVDELAPILTTTPIEFFSEEATNQFLAFLEYSNIKNTASVKDDTLEIYRIQCEEKDVKEVEKLFDAYRFAEEDNKTCSDCELSPEEEIVDDGIKESTVPYVKKKDQYADVNSTGIMLIVIGILGGIYVLLNYANVLNLLNGLISYTLNICLFAGAILYGFISLGHAKKLKSQIAEEEKIHDEILNWLDEQITKEFIEKNTDPDLPQEANDLKLFQLIKNMTMDQYSEVKENFIESIIDEKLTSLLE